MIKMLFNIIIMLLIIFSSVYTIARGKYAGKKVLHVDSYYAGYTWSDGIAAGIREAFKDTGIELKRIEAEKIFNITGIC